VRPATPADQPGMLAAIAASGLFLPDELGGIADMLTSYFAGSASDEHYWITDGSGSVGVAYYAPERMTNGTWNTYLIAVDAAHQGKGYGAALMAYIESDLTERGERVLLVETSGLPSFELTRAFYHKLGYNEEARIREFYNAGEDKVVFRKALTGPKINTGI
jgi:ribosomal protein S18 acetylase RimI-like enzyme